MSTNTLIWISEFISELLYICISIIFHLLVYDDNLIIYIIYYEFIYFLFCHVLTSLNEVII